MSDTTLTLVLEGSDISLDEFVSAATHWRSLVQNLSKQVDAAGVAWILDELSYGSATMATRGDVKSEKVPDLNRAYIDVGLAIERREEHQLHASVQRDASAIF